MKYQCSVAADASGAYTVVVKPYSVVTVTTLVNTAAPEFNTPLPIEGSRTVLDTDATGSGHDPADKILYADDFDYSSRMVPVIGAGGQITGMESYVTSRGGAQSVIPRYTSDRNGAFEAYQAGGSAGYVLRQQVDQAAAGLGGTWNSGSPITAIGDNRWLDYKASVDVSFENNSTQSGNNYASIGARQQGGSNSHYTNGTPYFLKFTFDGGWQLLVDGSAVASGNVVSGAGGVTLAGFKATYDTWHNLAIQVVDYKVTAYLDGTMLTSYTDAKTQAFGPRKSGERVLLHALRQPEGRDGGRLALVLCRATRRSRGEGSDPGPRHEADLWRLVGARQRQGHVQLPAFAVHQPGSGRDVEVHVHGDWHRHPGPQRRFGEAGGYCRRTSDQRVGEHDGGGGALSDVRAAQPEPRRSHRSVQSCERDLGRRRHRNREVAPAALARQPLTEPALDFFGAFGPLPDSPSPPTAELLGVLIEALHDMRPIEGTPFTIAGSALGCLTRFRGEHFIAPAANIDFYNYQHFLYPPPIHPFPFAADYMGTVDETERQNIRRRVESWMDRERRTPPVG